MSKSKPTKREREDAAYLRGEALRGQLDAFDGVQGALTDKAPIHDSGESPPPVCPHCQKRNIFPGIFTHMKQWDKADGWRLQCNECSGIVTVEKKVWQIVREDAVATFRDRPKPKRQSIPRQRGAG